MPHERLLALLPSASIEHLTALAGRRIASNTSLLNGPARSVMPSNAHPRMGSEHRRYIEAFEQWLAEPTREHAKIRRARLVALITAVRS